MRGYIRGKGTICYYASNINRRWRIFCQTYFWNIVMIHHGTYRVYRSTIKHFGNSIMLWCASCSEFMNDSLLFEERSQIVRECPPPLSECSTQIGLLVWRIIFISLSLGRGNDQTWIDRKSEIKKEIGDGRSRTTVDVKSSYCSLQRQKW